MTQQPLESKNVPAVTQVLDRERMTKPVRVYALDVGPCPNITE